MVQSGCLVPLNETCSPQTILILPLCYCPMCPIQWDRVQLNWTWFFSREGGDTESETGGRREGAREEGARSEPPVPSGRVPQLRLEGQEPQRGWGDGAS